MVIAGAGAGTYQTLAYDRYTLYWSRPDGRRGVDTMFRVVYYSHHSDPELMRAEARRLAPALWPVADRAGLTKLELKPSRPLLVPAFPLAVMSYEVHFRRDAEGEWREVQNW